MPRSPREIAVQEEPGWTFFLEACGLSESDPEVAILATLTDSTASRTSEETFCSQCFRS